MDHVPSRILAKVAAKSGENPDRRRGQGSTAMFVSRGLAGPKAYPNWSTPKGKPVNIPAPPWTILPCMTHPDRPSSAVALSKR